VVARTNCHWDPATAPPAPACPKETPKVSAHAIEEIAALLTNGKKTALGLELAGGASRDLRLQGQAARQCSRRLRIDDAGDR
jgi:hypothetical protein